MMKSFVWHDMGDIRLDTAREPAIQEPTDAIVRLTASAICGRDLHFIRAEQQDRYLGNYDNVAFAEVRNRRTRDDSPNRLCAGGRTKCT